MTVQQCPLLSRAIVSYLNYVVNAFSVHPLRFITLSAGSCLGPAWVLPVFMTVWRSSASLPRRSRRCSTWTAPLSLCRQSLLRTIASKNSCLRYQPSHELHFFLPLPLLFFREFEGKETWLRAFLWLFLSCLAAAATWRRCISRLLRRGLSAASMSMSSVFSFVASFSAAGGYQ